MKITMIPLALALALALPLTTTAAETKRDAQPAAAALNASLASADLAIALVNAQSALNEVHAQAAVNALTASIASADVSIAVAEAGSALKLASNDTMLAELEDLLETGRSRQADKLLAAVVSERPALAAVVQDMALAAGYDGERVTAAVVRGLAQARAAAAGE